MNNDDIDKIKHAITNYTNITEMRDIRDFFYPRHFDFPNFFFKEIYIAYFFWLCVTILVMLVIYFFNIFYQD